MSCNPKPTIDCTVSRIL